MFGGWPIIFKHKRGYIFSISLNMPGSLSIVGPPPPLIKGGVGPSENWVTWGGGGTNFFARKGG